MDELLIIESDFSKKTKTWSTLKKIVNKTVSMSTMNNNSVRAKLIASALNSANGANHNNNGLKKIQQNIIVIN